MATIEKQRPDTVRSMFGAIAENYDRGNAILSFQMHRLWNRALIRKVLGERNPEVFLDLCAGTGAIAYGYLKKRQRPCEAYLLDFCGEMLEVAQTRKEGMEQHTLHYLQADAQEVPLTDSSVDAATIAYGIRNVKEPKRCLADTYRVLRPGGCFGILELTRPTNGMLRLGHRIYLQKMLPRLGKWLLSNEEAYQYLCNSIEHFVEPQQIASQMRGVGFKDVEVLPLMGGIATIMRGWKR